VDFSLSALYEALDAQRIARGLSWAQATREINRQLGSASGHPISPSTVKGLRSKAVAEGDRVLQMLLWLNRAPEGFIPGYQESEEARLPDVPSHQILRFDTKKLYAALNAQRSERCMTWAQVANEIGVSASSPTHLSKGARSGFSYVMRITHWLGRPVARLVRLAMRAG
jgi:hypothetical protein